MKFFLLPLFISLAVAEKLLKIFRTSKSGCLQCELRVLITKPWKTAIFHNCGRIAKKTHRSISAIFSMSNMSQGNHPETKMRLNIPLMEINCFYGFVCDAFQLYLCNNFLCCLWLFTNWKKSSEKSLSASTGEKIFIKKKDLNRLSIDLNWKIFDGHRFDINFP